MRASSSRRESKLADQVFGTGRVLNPAEPLQAGIPVSNQHHCIDSTNGGPDNHEAVEWPKDGSSDS